MSSAINIVVIIILGIDFEYCSSTKACGDCILIQEG